MRPHLIVALLAGSVVCLVQRPSAAQPYDQPPPPRPPVAQPNPQGQLQNPDRAGSASLPSAVEAPLHDLNIMRQGIPPILLAAITDPYERPSPGSCAAIAAQVNALSAVLGADFDEPENPQNPSLSRKNGSVTLALIHGAAERLLPFAGFVRTLSGAQRHDQLVIEAITAGSVRRGYLKGLGESRRCPRPATPVHFLREPPPARENGDEPKYPIH